MIVLMFFVQVRGCVGIENECDSPTFELTKAFLSLFFFLFSPLLLNNKMFSAVFVFMVALASAQSSSYCKLFTAVDPSSGKSFVYDLSSLALPDLNTSSFIQLKESSAYPAVSYVNICGTTNSKGCSAPNTVVCQSDSMGNNFR